MTVNVHAFTVIMYDGSESQISILEGGTVKEQFFISNDTFIKWRETLKIVNDCAAVVNHLLSAVE